VRVVFFGTPEFAVPSLRALVGEGFDVVAVVTQPDAPQGRSRSKLISPPVKVAAEAEDLTVLQPEKPTDGAFLLRLRDLEPDIGVVVAYGHILKPELLELPRRGMVNVHPSLLPGLRGAAPIEWAVIRGHETTGVTIIQLDAGMDSGPILHQIPHRIPQDVTAGELSAHLAEMGAQALIETLAMLEQSDPPPKPVPQNESRATFAPKLTREIAHIDWTSRARTRSATRCLDSAAGCRDKAVHAESDGAALPRHGRPRPRSRSRSRGNPLCRRLTRHCHGGGAIQRHRRWYARDLRGPARGESADASARLAAWRPSDPGRKVFLRPPLPRLHAITDERIARRADLDAVACALADGGGSDLAFHARGRELTGLEHYRLSVQLSNLPSFLFINDRLDIALAVPAAGVQLGSNSLPVAAARALSPLWWIGKSVHDLAEAEAARAEGADYLVVGPVYATASHPSRKPLGVAQLRKIAMAAGDLPVIAIGGITVNRVREVRNSGAYGIAAIQAFWDDAEPELAVRRMREELVA